jgi:hypothetical protein
MDLVNILCLLFQIKTLGPCRDLYDNIQKVSDAFCVTVLDPLVSNTSYILTFVLLDIVVSLIRGMSSLDRNNLVVFYLLNSSEIWPDKRSVLWWEWSYMRRLLYLVAHIYCPLKKGHPSYKATFSL